MKMLDDYHHKLKECFGAWDISDEDYAAIWKDITHRKGRKWLHYPKIEPNS